MNAEIVSVGTELLLGQIVDTHAATMARILAECGIGCQRRTTVGDNLERLASVLKESLERADLVLTIGGLGPTMDDLTRDAITLALGDELEHVPEMESRLREFFAMRKMRFAENNARQSYRPRCARFIDNPNGTAPGLVCEKNGKTVIAMPGPKGEFEPMALGPVREFLSRQQGGVIHSRVLRVVGMGESLVEDSIKHLMQGENPTVAPYAHTGEVHLRLTARAATVEEADRLIDPLETSIRNVLGSHVYGLDSTSLEASVLQLLKDRKARMAVAESMTGGQLAARLTSVPGSSDTFVGGVVTYAMELKQTLLGVSGQTLSEFGPVSAETAREMALGALRMGVEYSLSITGNAGPEPDVDQKPVGLVYIGCAGPFGVDVEEHRFRGLREDVQRRATQSALAVLRDKLLPLE
ncbi:MAG TPA: competence/damage-inducible protein A [Fimbriimonas sp.]